MRCSGYKVLRTNHDGTRMLEDLEADLPAINTARCKPPLPVRQVQKIARSIHERTLCSPGPDPKELEALIDIQAAFWRTEWRGMGGKSERDIVVALIKLARRQVVSSTTVSG
jgi:hypothetical protein